MNYKHNIKEAIANELKRLRFEHNLTQSELSKQSNVDISTIVRYEKNNVTMQLDTIIKLVESFGISIFIFFEQLLAKTHEKE